MLFFAYHRLTRLLLPIRNPSFSRELLLIFSAIQTRYNQIKDKNLPLHRPIDEISADQKQLNLDKKWKAGFLYAYGNFNQVLIAQFPEIEKLILKTPEIQLVMFSTLEPGKHIPPHVGRNIAVNRLQLGIDIKQPERTLLRVGTTEIKLKEGELFAFDDTFEHEAKNEGECNRTVLIIDYAKKVPFFLKRQQRTYLEQISNSPYIKDAVKRW